MLGTTLLLLVLQGPWVSVSIPASKDTTLIEDPAGNLANGSGAHFFAGRNSQPSGSLRRALVHFDVAAHLPATAVVGAVELHLTVSQTNAGASPVWLHRASAAWSEGPSVAPGGGGALAGAGDTTWLHRTYPDLLWAEPGGDFLPVPSGVALVGGVGPAHWSSSARMKADVRQWLHAPHRNFGWLLLGDETQPTTVKRFDSRENLPAVSPRLLVTYCVR